MLISSFKKIGGKSNETITFDQVKIYFILTDNVTLKLSIILVLIENS